MKKKLLISYSGPAFGLNAYLETILEATHGIAKFPKEKRTVQQSIDTYLTAVVKSV